MHIPLAGFVVMLTQNVHSPIAKMLLSLHYMERRKTKFQTLPVETKYGYVFVASRKKTSYPVSCFAPHNDLFTASQRSRRRSLCLN